MSNDEKADALHQTLERMEIAARREGIEPGSALWEWFGLLRRLAELQWAGNVHASASMERALQSAREQLHEIQTTSAETFAHVQKQVGSEITKLNATTEAAHARIAQYEAIAEKQQTITISRMVDAIVKDLRTQVFHRIREQLPTQEVKFYREARWHAYTRLVMGGVILVVLGSALTMAATWPQFRRGGYCTSHTYINPNTSRAWCDLDDDTPHS